MLVELVTQLVKENIQFNYNNKEVTIYEKYEVRGVHSEVVTVVDQTYVLKSLGSGKAKVRKFNSVYEVTDYAKQFSDL